MSAGAAPAGSAMDLRTVKGGAMTREQAAAALTQALELSRQLLEAADSGAAEGVIGLDAERRRLIKSARPALGPLNDEDRAVLRQIADLNDRSLGLMEHRLRAKCRDMDLLAAGRRAVRAYASHRS